jgi:sec-independent protein translocase protein TatB
VLDIGWSELAVIGVVALVVVGPKDLPRLMREVGKFTSQARDMARQFRAGWDNMLQEAEIDDLKRKTQETVNDINPLSGFSNPLDEFKDSTRDMFDPLGSFDDAMNRKPDPPAISPDPAPPAPKGQGA